MADKEEEQMEKINSLILDISKGASFSSSAMQQFVELQSEVDSQESTIRYLRGELVKEKKAVTDRDGHIHTLEQVVDTQGHEIEGWKTRERELQDREEQRVRQEVELLCEKQRVEDHQNMVGLIFRNTELRKTSRGQEMAYQPGCVEIKDEYGNIKQYAEQAGFVGTPVEKEETETKE